MKKPLLICAAIIGLLVTAAFAWEVMSAKPERRILVEKDYNPAKLAREAYDPLTPPPPSPSP